MISPRSPAGRKGHPPPWPQGRASPDRSRPGNRAPHRRGRPAWPPRPRPTRFRKPQGQGPRPRTEPHAPPRQSAQRRIPALVAFSRRETARSSRSLLRTACTTYSGFLSCCHQVSKAAGDPSPLLPAWADSAGLAQAAPRGGEVGQDAVAAGAAECQAAAFEDHVFLQPAAVDRRPWIIAYSPDTW